MRDQVKNTAAACACVRCLFSVQVMVRLTPHAFSIKTTGSQLPRSELRVFTKEADTHEEEKKKPNREFTHLHLKDFDVCESGPGQGGWGLTGRVGA